MTDRSRVGFTTPASTVAVDPWRVRLFCQATGETDPTAWAPNAVVPPTFLKALESEHFSSAALLKLLDVPLAGVLHAEQAFDIQAPVFVGDQVEIQRRVDRIDDKKDGALTFIAVDTRYRVGERPVASSRQTILVRNQVAST